MQPAYSAQAHAVLYSLLPGDPARFIGDDPMNTPQTTPTHTPAPAPLAAPAIEGGATEPNRAAKVSRPKAAKAAKADKPVKPGKVVKAKHQPADVKATEENPQRSIVPVKFKERYADHGGSNGDRIAAALKAACETRDENGRVSVDKDALARIAKDNGIDLSAYAKLNPGMQRMNVGNRLRGMLRNEQTVTIGKVKFADWDKAKIVAKPAAVAA